MTRFNFDIDIDVADRDLVLRNLPHVPASIRHSDGTYSRHNTGIYLQSIPVLPLQGISAIDYESAEQDGWLKIDILNNHIYRQVRDNDHLEQLMNTEPMWEMLCYPEFTEQLFHVGNYVDVLAAYKPNSVEQLAMILAMIRPGKRHLLGKSWAELEREIWVPLAEGYQFKRAHAISYAMVIVVQMNLICEQLINSAN